jgi:hypothetical protein
MPLLQTLPLLRHEESKGVFAVTPVFASPPPPLSPQADRNKTLITKIHFFIATPRIIVFNIGSS